MFKLFKPYLLFLIPVLAVLAVGCKDDVVDQDPPTITSVSPVEASPGEQVIISGTNLGDASSVMFGSVEASSFDANELSITAIVPTNAIAGSQNITVTTPGGTAITTFTVLQ